MKSCCLVREDNGTYSLTIVAGTYPILMQSHLSFELAMELINEFMYGEEET